MKLEEGYDEHTIAAGSDLELTCVALLESTDLITSSDTLSLSTDTLSLAGLEISWITVSQGRLMVNEENLVHLRFIKADACAVAA